MLTATAKAEIEAAIEKVWQIMLDVQRYGEWNPFIVKIDADGPVRVGGRFVLHVRWLGGGWRSAQRVTRLDGPSDGRASWSCVSTGSLSTSGAVRTTRVQSLESVGAKTRYSTHEELSGWLHLRGADQEGTGRLRRARRRAEEARRVGLALGPWQRAVPRFG